MELLQLVNIKLELALHKSSFERIFQDEGSIASTLLLIRALW